MKNFEVTCPNCQQQFEVEVPKVQVKRGQLYGIAVPDMTDEQLKREIINSKSVLYKAKQRGASDETIAANQARVDAAMAEKEKRQGAKATAKVDAPNVAAAMESGEAAPETAEGDAGVYNEETASEI